MASIFIKSVGISDVERGLQTIADGIDNARPMYDEIGGYLDAIVMRRFEEGKGPDGNPWPPSLRALATGGQTLVDSEFLRLSIGHNAWATGVEHGASAPYANVHQFGMTVSIPEHQRTLQFKTNKKGTKVLKGFRKSVDSNFSVRATVGAHSVKMPARPFIGMDDNDENEVISIAESYVQSLISKASGG